MNAFGSQVSQFSLYRSICQRQQNNTMSKVIDLYDFLQEAELHQYYSELKNELKVNLIFDGI